MKYSLFFSFLFTAQAIFSVTPHAYVTDQLGEAIRVIDISNNTVQTILGFDRPRVVKVTSDGKFAYIGSDDNTVRIIDTFTHTLLPTIISIDHPIAMALTPDGQHIFIVSANNTVSVVQTSDYSIISQISGLNNPQDIKLSPDGSFAYVTNAGDGTVTMIQTSDHTIARVISGFESPVGITFTVDGDYAYVSDKHHNSVYVIRTADHFISDVILGFNFPSYIAVTPDKSYAFVSNTGNHTISIFRTKDNFIIGSIPIPEPKSLAVTQDGVYLLVGSDFGNVFKVRVLDREILIAIPGFHNPSNITLTTNNSPGNTVNGCQIAVNANNIYNQISWEEAAGNPIGYKIFSDESLLHPIATLPQGTLQYRDNGLEEGQTYSYYVLANYENGFSSTIGGVEITPSRICQGF